SRSSAGRSPRRPRRCRSAPSGGWRGFGRSTRTLPAVRLRRIAGRCADEPGRSRLCHDSPVSHAPVRRRRQRLDQLVVDRGLADSRSRAEALILGGKVRTGFGDGARTDRKAGDLVEPDLAIELAAEDPYVSRGGHKLATALDAFEIDPAGLVCLDAGASTGG